MPEENSVPPQRFIRTFQTDLAKVQSNQPAGPVPLPEPGSVAQQAPVEQASPAPSIPQTPSLAPISSPPAPPVTIPVPVALSKPVQSAPPVAPKPIPTPSPASQMPQAVPPPVAPVPLPKPAFQPLPPIPSPPILIQQTVRPEMPTPPTAKPLPPLPAPPPARIEAPAPQPAPGGEVTSAPLHTFKTDFSSLFKQRKASVATLIAAQQDEQRVAPELYQKPKNRRTLVYVIVGGVLLVCGIVAALYAYGAYLTKNVPVALAPVAPAPIFVDERVQITGTGALLLEAIVQSVANPIASGHVRLLYTAESLSGTSTVFASLQLPAPGRVLRNLTTDGAMAGVVNVGGVQSPFFVLPVSSYGETFAGMLSWETSMKSDLAALFPGFPPVIAATSTATTTPAKKGTKAATTIPAVPVYVAGFRDEVIANHDARVYRDEANRVVLVYGYWNQSMFVIARDGAALAEILQRLATSRTE